jgi:hypothetical protein
MWNMKVKAIPIITGVNESLLQIFQTYLNGIPGKYSSTELKKRRQLWEQNKS